MDQHQRLSPLQLNVVHGEQCVCNHCTAVQRHANGRHKCRHCGRRHHLRSLDDLCSPEQKPQAAHGAPDIELVAPGARDAMIPFRYLVTPPAPRPPMPYPGMPMAPQLQPAAYYECAHAMYYAGRQPVAMYAQPQMLVPVPAMGMPVIYGPPVVNVQQNFIICPHCAAGGHGRN